MINKHNKFAKRRLILSEIAFEEIEHTNLFWHVKLKES